jgi:hypothetical protein
LGLLAWWATAGMSEMWKRRMMHRGVTKMGSGIGVVSEAVTPVVLVFKAIAWCTLLSIRGGAPFLTPLGCFISVPRRGSRAVTHRFIHRLRLNQASRLAVITGEVEHLRTPGSLPLAVKVVPYLFRGPGNPNPGYKFSWGRKHKRRRSSKLVLLHLKCATNGRSRRSRTGDAAFRPALAILTSQA